MNEKIAQHAFPGPDPHNPLATPSPPAGIDVVNGTHRAADYGDDVLDLGDLLPGDETNAFSPANTADKAADEASDEALDEALEAGGAEARFVSFSLDGNAFVMPVRHLVEVEKLSTLTPFPYGPGWLLGLTNLRGEILSVIDGRRLFGFAPAVQPELSRMCVLRASEITTALMVDRVEGLVYLSSQDIRPAGSGAPPLPANWLQGTARYGQRSFHVLNPDEMLQSLDHSW